MSSSFSRYVARLITRLAPGMTSLPPDDGAPKERLEPKLFTVIRRRGYTAKDFSRDLMAGVAVGVVAMPLAMAFAIASGVEPIQGLYTAIIAGLVIGLLGGSRYQISGPTGAFVVIIYSIIYRHGYDGLVITTLIAGILLVLAGFFRLGTLIKFIPYPVVTGFTAGIAVIIFSSQMGDFFGLPIAEGVPPEFFSKWSVYLKYFNQLSPLTVSVAGGTLVLMLVIRRFFPKVPAPVAGVVFGGLIVWAFGLPVETIASRYGDIPATLPSFHWPEISIDRIQVLFPDAVTIALLAGLESLLTCVVADSMTGSRHSPNMELIGQGAGNLACALFGGIPATGAIARTATNISSGAYSPVASLIHALTVLAFVLWLSPLTSAIPLASLAAVMVIIAYGMVETKAIKAILNGPAVDWAVMLLTFSLTVVVDLTVAVYMGVILASLLFVSRMSSMTEISVESREKHRDDHDLPEGVLMHTVNGPIFFGMADRFQNMITGRRVPTRVYVLNLEHVPAIDATGVHVLEAFLAHRSDGYQVVLAGVPAPSRRILRRMGLLRTLGEDNVCHTVEAALARAASLAGSEG